MNCQSCGKAYSSRYISRHNCLTSENSERVQNEELLKENIQETQQIPITNEDEEESCLNEESNNRTFEETDDNILSDDEFGSLFDEIYHQDEEVLDETDSDSSILVRWFCLFLAYWQMHFSITDSALEFLLKFITVFFGKIISLQPSSLLKRIHEKMPSSLYKFHQTLLIEKSHFKKYVVCIKCFALYDFEESRCKYRGEYISSKCSFRKFPNHRSKHLRKQCGQELLKTVKSSSGGKMLFPYKTYCYREIKKSLQNLLQNRDFFSQCNQWRTRDTSEDIYSDVFDGAIWKSFQREGQWYFESSSNLAVMLNVDWFRPYKHISSISVGGIYLIIMNFPRELRFLKENVILSGIIPSMDREPPTNTFIKPLVDELNMAWSEGFGLKHSTNIVCVHVALICVGCDIPACRKLCGFLGKLK